MRTARLLASVVALLCTSLVPFAARAADKDDKSEKTDKDKDKGDEKKKPPPAEEAAAGERDINDVTETAHKTYYFVGLRYRGTIVPKFMMNLFVDEGTTFYSNTIGAELDMRKDGESKVFALQYVEYGMGDTLFLQKGKPAGDEGNWSYVNSSLKGIYATVDLLWSAPIARHFDFEYGFGAGIGFIFGDLINNWVYQDDVNGTLVASNGHKYGKCTGANTPPGHPGCTAAGHQNAQTIKAAPGGYVEPTWFSGGSIPNVFLHLSIPQIGIRYKINRDIESRLGLGFSLTGFWFGLSADYGLPSNKKTSEAKGSGPQIRFGNANTRQTL